MNGARMIEALVSLRYRLDEPRAWRQGGKDPDGRSWTLEGAVMATVSELEERAEVVRVLCAAAKLPASWAALVGWNDAMDRTHGEVVRLLDRAKREIEVNGISREERTCGSAFEKS